MEKNNKKEKNANQIPNDILLKINFIGDSKCGKTCLIKSLLYSKYFQSSNDTIMSIYHIDLDKIDNFNVSLNIS
jgi:GTPase SAR1 family protein